MITLDRVTKLYPTQTGRVPVLRDVSLQIRHGEHIGIVGRNGAGKSTLIRLIAGVETPDGGTVKRMMSVSWPLAFGGAFVSSLTGLDNFKFICRIYGVDYKNKRDFVENFSELGKYFLEPIKSYSSGMRARLAFAISMAVEFDCFLVDEVVAVGDQKFQKKCNEELFEKRKDRAMIIVSHDLNYVKNHCDKFYILSDGILNIIDDNISDIEY